MKIELDDWQKKVLETEGNICLRSGRQVGKSTVISFKAAQYALGNRNKVILVISSVERQAQLLFDKIFTYIHENQPKMIKGGKEKPTKHIINLTNGSVIYCLPTGLAGRGIRGYTIDLLIADEAHFIPEAVWSAVTPMIATRTKEGARMILLSTPFGREGFFYRCFSDTTFTSFHISSEDCPRIEKEFLKQEKARMTKMQYAQEYLGEFVDELRQFFNDKLILDCMKVKRRDGIKGGNYYLGVDIARMGTDESTFEIIDKMDKENLMHVENQITIKTKLTDTVQNIITLDKLYQFRKIYIDDGGLGAGVFDMLLLNEQVRRKIIGINNASKSLDREGKKKKRLNKNKEELYTNLLLLMEKGRIKLLDDPEVFQSLKSVQYEYGDNGELKLFGNDTHIAEGLIRAVWGFQDKSLNIYAA